MPEAVAAVRKAGAFSTAPDDLPAAALAMCSSAGAGTLASSLPLRTVVLALPGKILPTPEIFRACGQTLIRRSLCMPGKPPYSVAEPVAHAFSGRNLGIEVFLCYLMYVSANSHPFDAAGRVRAVSAVPDFGKHPSLEGNL